VSRIEQDMPLILEAAPPTSGTAAPCGLQRDLKVIPSVDHEHRHLHARCKIHRVRFGKHFLPIATACGKYGSFETLRNSKHDGAPDGT
jgi:hypothetical protein